VYVIRERFFGLGDDFDITDETGRPVFGVDGKVLSLRDRLVLHDRASRQVAEVHRKLVALGPSYGDPTQDSKGETEKDIPPPACNGIDWTFGGSRGLGRHKDEAVDKPCSKPDRHSDRKRTSPAAGNATGGPARNSADKTGDRISLQE
jgi:hypothetical protein